MKQFCIILLIIITTSSFAQTKLIDFKSHSGNMANFSIALENALFNEEGSNFGNPPYKTVFVLDSVIYLSPTSAVLVRKEYHYPWDQHAKDTGEFIRANRDTLHDASLFSNKHSLDSIRRVMSAGYYKAMYDTKKTVFAGYDNKKTKEKKKDSVNANQPKENTISPIVTTNNNTDNNSPFDAAMAKALAAIFLLALLGGWLSSKFYTLRLQKA